MTFSEGNCTVDAVLNYSIICLDIHHPDFDPASCYRLDVPMKSVAAVICIINSIVGCCGNMLTLLAIPYAMFHNKFGFRRQRDPTTILVLNLALADFIYCVVNLPLYATLYIYGRWPFGETTCIATSAFRYINAYAEWMSLAVIALSRCLGLVRNTRCFNWRQGYLVVLGIWLYAFLLTVPVLIQVSGRFGFNCRFGKCDYIAGENAKIDPHTLYYAIGFGIPCIVILISYSVIWCYAKNSARYLRKSSKGNRQSLVQREQNMTFTLFLICLCYVVFVMPIASVNIIDPLATMPDLHLAFFCVYWFQYSLNFLIYAARCEGYRSAYLFFLTRMGCCLKEKASSTLYLINKEHRVVTNRPWMQDLIHVKSQGESKVSTTTNRSIMVMSKKRKCVVWEQTQDEICTTSYLPDSIQEEVILRVQTRFEMRRRSCTL